LIEVDEAKRLASGDETGKSDPYVRLKWGGEDREWQVGMTYWIKDEENPIWEGQQFVLPVPKAQFDEQGVEQLPLHPAAAAGLRLHMEVRDHDPVGLGDHLGNVFFKAQELLNHDEGEHDFDLYRPPEKYKAAIKGHLYVQVEGEVPRLLLKDPELLKASQAAEQAQGAVGVVTKIDMVAKEVGVHVMSDYATQEINHMQIKTADIGKKLLCALPHDDPRGMSFFRIFICPSCKQTSRCFNGPSFFMTPMQRKNKEEIVRMRRLKLEELQKQREAHKQKQRNNEVLECNEAIALVKSSLAAVRRDLDEVQIWCAFCLWHPGKPDEKPIEEEGDDDGF
jgi:hypothetical protein